MSILFKPVAILYLVVFSLYIFFSRQPDYLDGEFISATIHFTKTHQAKALFVLNGSPYIIDAGYFFRHYTEGQQVVVIYENTNPQKATIYSWWGYWITLGEVIFSVFLLLLTYFIATTITKNPTPEALMEELEYKPAKKKKYSD